MKKLTLLFLIIALGGTLRFYRLGEVPAGFHRDEAFLGYNAYSITKTGHDMSGVFLPLNLQSLVYSPAGYSYLSIPFISIFGLTPFSVRFVSALFGTATILTTYFLVLGLLKKTNVAFASSFFLAISPWHINLSRTATENTIVVFFITIGILLYLSWCRRPVFMRIFLSFLAFSATMAIYQAPRAFLPIFIPLMIVMLGVPKHRWHTLLVLYIATIILPITFILWSPQLSLRIKTVSIFATSETQLVLDEQIREDGVSAVPRLLTRIFHNKITGYTDQLLKNYFSHFSYDFLFTDKVLPDRYRVPNAGLLYIFELPLLILGIHFLWLKNKRTALFLFGWVMTGPIGSALTFDDVPNLQRTLLMFPVPSIITAVGAIALINLRTQRNIIRRLLTAGKIALILLGTYNFFFYLEAYYVHQLVHRPWFRQEGYQELVSRVHTLLPKFERAVITNRESAPTIFFLFFGKYDPGNFQRQTHTNVAQDLDRINFDRYEFSEEECPLRLEKKVDPATGAITTHFTGINNFLYVNFGTCSTPENYATELTEIRRGDNSIVFKIVTPKNYKDMKSKP